MKLKVILHEYVNSFVDSCTLHSIQISHSTVCKDLTRA